MAVEHLQLSNIALPRTIIKSSNGKPLRCIIDGEVQIEVFVIPIASYSEVIPIIATLNLYSFSV